MKKQDYPTSLEEIDEDAEEIIRDVAEELEIDFENVVMPYHKLDVLYEDLSEEEFRDHMKKTLKMLQ